MHFGLDPTPQRKQRIKTINAGLWADFDQGKITQEALVVERYARFLEQEGVEGDPATWNDYGLHALAENPLLIPGAERLCRNLSEKYTLALVTNGVDYVQLGQETARMVAGLLVDGDDPASTPVRIMTAESAVINTETCAALNLNYD